MAEVGRKLRTTLAEGLGMTQTLDDGNAKVASHTSTCAEECEACACACEACIQALAGQESANVFNDCASVCRLAADFFARESGFAKQISQQCARICAACIAECRARQGSLFDNCARACEACIRHCG